jgi:hypothetical protein
MNKEKKIFRTILLGLYLLIMAGILAYLLIKLWPDSTGKLNELIIIKLVILSGALGSYVHAATSFATYVGNRSLEMSWTWWYILRPFIGMALALIFYFVIRGGFFTAGADDNLKSVNLFGIAAVAGLVGLFSKQATDKLRELFDNLFRTVNGKGDDIRKDKLEEELPVSDRMIPVNKMSVFTLPEIKDQDDDPATQVKIKDLFSMLKGLVTRIPVFDNKGIVKYIIHQSVLYKFIAEKSMNAAKTSDFETLTLRDFLDYKGIEELVSGSFVFVSKDATLGDAKLKMETTKNCQDVFVTENGIETEPVEGWLTNIEITKNIKA